MPMNLKSMITGTNLSATIDKVKPLLAAGAFIEQLTEKDRKFAQASFDKYPIEMKAAWLLHVTVGRTIGYKLNPEWPAYPRTFKPINAILNKYTGFWVAAEAAGELLKAVVPFTAKFVNPIQKVARTVVVPGAIGAIFDDPYVKSPSTKPAWNGQRAHSEMLMYQK